VPVKAIQKINHPTDNGELPSFVHPTLAENLSDLDLVDDCWEQLKGSAKEKHLPKEPGEPGAAYKNRVRRSSYPSFYRDGIIAFSGILSRYELRKAPESLVSAAQNIDGKGNSLKKWGIMANCLGFRHGGCVLMADMPGGKPSSRADEIATGRRPVLTMAERRNVLNWEEEEIGGRMVPVRVTILEWHRVKDGRFGVKLEPRYRVMEGGEWRLLEIRGTGGKDGFSVVQVEGEQGYGQFLGSGNQPLDYPPVCWYSPTGDSFGEGDIPMLSLANLSLDWFRSYSSLKELLNKCALPVTWIRDAGRPRDMPLVLGPNSWVHLIAEDSAIGFAEPSGSSLEQHLKHMEGIEKLIDKSTLAFMGEGSGGRTATEALLDSAQLQATITSSAESMSSAFETLFRLWGQFTGEVVEAGAGLDMLQGLTDKPVDDPLLQLASTLYDKGLLMRETVTHLVAKRGMLRPGVSAEDEAKALAEEDAKREALLNPPLPDENDPDTQDDTDAQGLPLA
jgi:hypothetical protein